MVDPRLSDDIAIIGMSCIFPGAPDVSSFWRNILSKVSAISESPDSEVERYFDPQSDEFERIYCKRAGYIRDIARFDPLKFGVVPSSVEGGDYDHFIALELVHGALFDAGLLDKPFPREKTEVILGHGTYINPGNTNWLQHSLVLDQTIDILKRLNPQWPEARVQQVRNELKESLPSLNPHNIPSLIPNIMAGRIANRFDFMGGSYIVDGACASSLLAIECGMKDLLLGKCDVAVVGGIQGYLPPAVFMLFCELDALSRSSAISPFSRKADGTLLGEGAGVIILRRRKDAEKEKDKIYALIKGVGISSDGRARGLLAPRLDGEVLAMQRAYEVTGVAPASVELIEAHGTGIPLGDLTEIEALTKVFGLRQKKNPHCAVGTVKSMIGHCIPAAGIAGIIKTTLALYHKILPPTINCDEPNPQFNLERTPFYINTEARPWTHTNGGVLRRGGVNAFGFGGINAHCILEEYPEH